MSDNKETDTDPTTFGIAPYGDDPNDPDFVLIKVPVKHYAKMGPEGVDMAYGKCRRIESIVVNLVRSHWEKSRAKKSGIVVPSVIGKDGKPLNIA